MIHSGGLAVSTVLLLLCGVTVLASPDALDAPATVARRAAVRAFAERGEEAFPELAAAFQSDAWLVRATACIALGEIGIAAETTLRPAFDDPDEFVRRQQRAPGLRGGRGTGPYEVALPGGHLATHPRRETPR